MWRETTSDKAVCYVPKADGTDLYPIVTTNNATMSNSTMMMMMMSNMTMTMANMTSGNATSSLPRASTTDGKIAKTNQSFIDGLTSTQKYVFFFVVVVIERRSCVCRMFSYFNFLSIDCRVRFSPFNLCILSAKEAFKLVTGEVACIVTVASPGA